MAEEQQREFSWSADGERFTGEHSTVFDAAVEAVIETDLLPGDTVEVGENIGTTAEDLVRGCFDAATVIDMLSIYATDNYGECAEGWPDIYAEQSAKLEGAVVAAIAPLLDAPLFWSIASPRQVEITLGMFLTAHPPEHEPRCRYCYEMVTGEAQLCAAPDSQHCEPFTVEDVAEAAKEKQP